MVSASLSAAIALQVHTVQIVCTNPGTSGCYVDWIGGNGAAARPNLPPYLWTGVTYHTLQNGTDEFYAIKNGIVRTVEQQLESDGLAIRSQTSHRSSMGLRSRSASEMGFIQMIAAT